MNQQTFEQEVLRRRLSLIERTLASKAAEYATDDRLHNFKRAAAMLEDFPESACVGFMTKHLVSVLDIVDRLPVVPTREMIDEKIGDAINYLILLEALLVERIATASPRVQ